MAYEIEQRFEHIGTEILEASRNALYINMRYLDVALSGLAWEMTTDISRIGTDGLRLCMSLIIWQICIESIRCWSTGRIFILFFIVCSDIFCALVQRIRNDGIWPVMWQWNR